jgi:tripartite-type tricarboxylate transporter receptor subunit TctC
VGALALGDAAEAAWPEKPVTVVVPFQAGGTSDQVTRAFQAAIQEEGILAQPITIINVGGHYSIGSRRVLESEPDGHEFLVIHVALMGGEGTGVLDFSWRDFTPVAATGQFCVAPMVRKDSGIDSVDELLAQRMVESPSAAIEYDAFASLAISRLHAEGHNPSKPVINQVLANTDGVTIQRAPVDGQLQRQLCGRTWAVPPAGD